MCPIYDRKVRASELLRLYKKILRAQSAEWRNADEGLLEAFQLGTITEKQYQKEQHFIQTHRFELTSKEVILARNVHQYRRELEDNKESDWPGIIESLLLDAFHFEITRRIDAEEREDNKGCDPAYIARAKLARKLYNSYSPDDTSDVCVLSHSVTMTQHFR